MKGRLLDFSAQYDEGIILSDDNQRYSFIGAEWKENFAPQRGQEVDFSVNQLGQAVAIYVISQPSPWNTHFSRNHALLAEEEKYGFLDWCIKCLKNYVNFSGRARRKEYWFFYLFQILIGFTLGLILAITGFSKDTIDIFSGLINLALFLPALAVSVRRLHDVGRSGWWWLIAFTIIGLIPLFIWTVTETKQEKNQWGSPAK